MVRNLTLPLIASLALVLGCTRPNPGPDLEALRAEILALHEGGIQAHLDGDPTFFTAGTAEPFFSVSGGEIREQTRADVEQTYAGYLGSTEFSEYRNLREPIVGVSDDGSVGWIIAQVKVTGARTGEDGSEQTMEFVGAFITLYQRRDGAWLRMANAVNFKFGE